MTVSKQRTPDPDPNLVIFVTNQSYDNPLVDIEVTIDGEQVVSQEFAVGNQHNFKVIQLHLPDGIHTIGADSVKGEASMTNSFELPSKRWALLWYGYDQKRLEQGFINADKAFGFQLHDEPIGIE